MVNPLKALCLCLALPGPPQWHLICGGGFIAVLASSDYLRFSFLQ